MEGLTLAEKNLARLRNNEYPGRLDLLGKWRPTVYLVGTAITVRSVPNRNRCYWLNDDNSVEVIVADPTKESGDPNLTLYKAIQEGRFNLDHTGQCHIVGNGRQTDVVLKNRMEDDSMRIALHGDHYLDVEPQSPLTYEPDALSTPRITGVLELYNEIEWAGFSMLMRSPVNETPYRIQFDVGALEVGTAYVLHTYDSDGEPPPIFSGHPYPIDMFGGTPEEVFENFWAAIHETNRVAVALKFIDLESGSNTVIFRNVTDPVPA